ncbi:MAG: hypothetical protein AAF267_20450 [Deinococcota bacterium]
MTPELPTPKAISDQEKQRIRTLIHCLGKSCDIDIKFSDGQREGDIYLLHLHGNTERSLELYDFITQALPRYNLLLLNEKSPGRFGLEAALVQPLLEATQSNDSRRKNIFLHQFKSSSLILQVATADRGVQRNNIYELVASLASRLSVVTLLAPEDDPYMMRFYLDGDRDVLVKLFTYSREALPDVDIDLISSRLPSEEDQRFVEYTIGRAAQDLSLQIEFSPGQRRTDILVMEVGGELPGNLELYRRISEDLPEYAIQLFNLPSPEFGRRAALVQKVPLGAHDPERRTDFRSLSESTQW